MSKVRFVAKTAGSRILTEVGRLAPIYRVSKKHKQIAWSVDATYCAAVEERLRQDKIDYTVHAGGVRHAVQVLWHRPALWIGMLLVCAVLGAMLNTVWVVDIDSETDDPALTAVLQEVLPHYPVWKQQVDAEAIRQKLLSVEGVALASVYVKGMRLQVEVRHELPKQPIKQPNYAPIVAAYDCIVTRVVVERGRALVQPGDSVRKGDVLIAPEYLVDKDADVTVPDQAVGEVYGKAYLSTERTFCEYTTVYKPTGQTAIGAVMEVAGTVLGTMGDSPYTLYEEKQEKIALGIAVPVTVYRTTWIELEETQVYEPWDTAKERVQNECKEVLLQQLKKNVQYSRFWCIISNIGSTYTVRAYMEVEEQVGVVNADE